MLREATDPPAAVNVLDVSSESMAAFQVFTYGRFWVFTEVLVGENHAMPAHMIFQMCLFDILRKAKLVFGVALEHPSNWVVTCSLNLLSEDPQTKVFTVSNAHRIIDEQLAGDPVTHQLLYAAAF
jgi:hypothetical protein